MRNYEIKLCAGVLDAVIIKNVRAYNHAVTLFLFPCNLMILPPRVLAVSHTSR